MNEFETFSSSVSTNSTPYTQTSTLVNETFAGTTISDSAWILGNLANSDRPFLTANTIDTDNNGVLRLTSNKPEQAAFALYNQAISLENEISITFDFFAYGSTGADGISLFLVDAAQPTATVPGGFGGSLGYAPREGIPGLAGSFLGIGFDHFGNFSNPTEGREGGTGLSPDAVVVRGGESNNYSYLTGQSVPFSLDDSGASNRETALRRATVNLTQEGLLSVVVQADLNQDGDFEDTVNSINETIQVIDAFDVRATNGELPTEFKIGIAASTGLANNIHEIRNLQITSHRTLINQHPETTDVEVDVFPATLTAVTGLNATDTDGTIASFTITRLPDAVEGTLFLGDPAAGGTAISVGQVLTLAEANQLFFQSHANFNGATFTYTATDDRGGVDQTPAIVNLKKQVPLLPPDLDPENPTPPEDKNPNPGNPNPGNPNPGNPNPGNPNPGNPDPLDNPQTCQPGHNLKGDRHRNRLKGGADSDRVRGFGGNDHLSGHDCGDQLDGGRGNDIAYGGGRNDRLQGRQQHDRLHGNHGDDSANGGLGHDYITGGRGKDRLHGRRGTDKLRGKYGDDFLSGGRQNDYLRGGSNHDLLRGNQNDDDLSGERGIDTLSGGLGHDLLRGGVGSDRLFGRRGNDRLVGGQGRDTLNGGLGNDLIIGGHHADRLAGSAGADRFVYRSLRDRGDRIVDFEVGEDVIDLRPILNDRRYTSGNSLTDYVKFVQQGSTTQVQIDANGSLAGGFQPLVILNHVQAISLGSRNVLV